MSYISELDAADLTGFERFSLAQPQEREKMDSYMFVYIPTDESTLLPRHVSWIEDDSVGQYSRQVEQALLERWPDVDVDVMPWHHKLHVETDVQDCTNEEVQSIIDAVWSRFDWLVTAD